MTHYIDIDSTYRDRTLYPNPADFTVFSKTFLPCDHNIENDVSLAAIKYPIHGMYAYPIAIPQANQLIIDPLNYPVIDYFYNTDAIPPNQNIYNNNILELFNDDSTLIISTFYTIIDTVYQNEIYNLETGSVYADVDSGGRFHPDPYAAVYLAATSSNINGYYIGKFITVNGDTRQIVTYYGATQLAQVDAVFTAPVLTGSDFIIFTDQTWTLILDRDITPTGTLKYPSQLPNTAGNNRNLYRIRLDIPFFQGTIIIGTAHYANFSSNASATSGIYIGKWIVITNSANAALINQRQKIAAYDGATKLATFAQPFSAALNPNDTFDILTVNEDGFYHLTGFIPNTFKCFQLSLHSISIPNIPIQNGVGDIISSYPFIYVEFAPKNTTYQNIFINNIPNLTKITFKVPIYNVITPDISTFIVLRSNMVQTVKLNVMDEFIVRLYLPDGEIIIFDQADSLIPNPPRPEVQISYTFKLVEPQ